MTTMPFDRKIEITIGDGDPIPILDSMLGEIGAHAAQGDPNGSSNRDSDDESGGGGQGCYCYLTGIDGRQQHRVHDPSDDKGRHDRHGGEQDCTNTTDDKLPRSSPQLPAYQMPALTHRRSGLTFRGL
jgi:hypothetical protein